MDCKVKELRVLRRPAKVRRISGGAVKEDFLEEVLLDLCLQRFF